MMVVAVKGAAIMGGMKKNLEGKVFGRLTVQSVSAARDNTGSIMWNCLCECGNTTLVCSPSLLRGNTKSCGCLNKERFHNRKHGLSNHKLYSVWEGMIQRCYNPKDKKYPMYGGRGIQLCEEWRQNFQAFYDWAKENRYEVLSGDAKLSIDRIDNEKGYSPDNCRWSTYSEQNVNRRPYYHVTEHGVRRN
jgi:hypothetical protein